MISWVNLTLNSQRLSSDMSDIQDEEQTGLGQATIVGLTLLLVCVFSSGLFLNCSVLFCTLRQRRLRCVAGLLVCNLAFSDTLLLFFGGVPFELMSIYQTGQTLGSFSFVCVLRAFLSELATVVSVATVLLLTYERYLAICRPLSADGYLHSHQLRRCLTFVWLCSGVPSALMASQYGSRKLDEFDGQPAVCDLVRPIVGLCEATFALLFLLPMVFIVTCYILIIREINNSIHRLQMYSGAASLVNTTYTHGKVVFYKLSVFAVGTFFLTAFPLHIQRLIATRVLHDNIDDQSVLKFLIRFDPAVAILQCAGAAFTPFLYAVSLSRYRSVCVQWFKNRGSFCRSSNRGQPPKRRFRLRRLNSLSEGIQMLENPDGT